MPLAGAPEQRISDAPAVRQVALLGADAVGLKAGVLVQPGERVRRGQPVIEDKSRPAVRYAAPAAGTVQAVNRGDKRAFRSLVIEVADDDGDDAQLPIAPLDAAGGAEAVRQRLLASGLWTALRERPFSRVPAPDSRPYAIFVTAADTRPHAPDVAVVLSERWDDFAAGVDALGTLTDGAVHVCCTGPIDYVPMAGSGVQVHRFEGPHPAGNAGTHIHFIAPVDLERRVWHVGYQDVAAIGRLLRTGRIDVQRVVSLAGPQVARPRLLRTRVGASLAELTRGELKPGVTRVVSGSLLDGRSAVDPVEAFLGRYHLQVSALAEATERELFGWIMPGFDKFSVWGVVAGAFTRRPQALTTTTNGGARAMVPIGSFERVMPMDLMPTFLLRALLTKGDERAEKLGALELDEEDLALCTFVCPGKAEYGPLLRAALARIEKESAA